MVYTLKEHQDMIDEIASLRQQIDEIKQSDDDKANIIKDYQTRYKTSLDEVRHEIHQEYKAEVNRLNQEIKDNQSMIKEYQSMIKDYEDRQSDHNKELDDYKAVIYDLSTKYNNLRIAIQTTSRLDVFFNKHKKILKEYPEITMSSNTKVIDTKSADDKS